MTEERKAPAPCTQAIFEDIIIALHQGVTLSQWLDKHREIIEYPTRSAIMRFINADNARKARYASAREDCADALAEDVVRIADSTLDPQRAANGMKSRQFLASKLKPKVYGDKLDLEVTGRIDVQTAILAARKRSQVIEHDNIIDITTTDIQSDDDSKLLENKPYIDPFS